MRNEIIIDETHRGLWFEDRALTRQLGAGRYEIPAKHDWLGRSRPSVHVVLVDLGERNPEAMQRWRRRPTRGSTLTSRRATAPRTTDREVALNAKHRSPVRRAQLGR